ncbi:MAG: hypothetical protein N3G19_03505 [Candidatus Pacearchaeota archaeon]|nr:hypothetical protein [Candidatus Pacearchaeota archaeon]
MSKDTISKDKIRKRGNFLSMLNEIEREKKMAEHLFYVSLKYTKTGDVILNLIERWEKMIDKCIELLLKRAKKMKAIREIPIAPKARELAVRDAYKDELVQEVMDMYSFFRKLPTLEKIREHEFRKNVAIRVLSSEGEIEINIDKLKEWNESLNSFINYVRHIIQKKG